MLKNIVLSGVITLFWEVSRGCDDNWNTMFCNTNNMEFSEY